MQQYRHSPRKEIFMFEIRQVPAIEALEKIKEGDVVYIGPHAVDIFDDQNIRGKLTGYDCNDGEEIQFTRTDIEAVTRNGIEIARDPEETPQPFKAEDAINAIVDSLKKDGRWPVILDYIIPCSEDYTFKSGDICASYDISYGGSEGIYTELYLIDFSGDEEIKIKIATTKTLEDDAGAYRTMAMLGANLVLAFNEWVRKNRDLFIREGYGLMFYTKTGDRKYIRFLKESKYRDNAIREAIGIIKNGDIHADLVEFKTLRIIKRFD